jgi:hypothetical protein
MTATGGIQQLGDAKLRERVSNYYNAMQTSEFTLNTVPPFREHLRQVMPYGFSNVCDRAAKKLLGKTRRGW